VERVERDVRAFVVGERVAAAVARRPRPGDFRGNTFQGGRARAITLGPEVASLAVRATSEVGLDYGGVDLLLTDGEALVIEVNGTPSFRALNAATGRDMARAIVDHAVKRVRRSAGRAARRPDHARSARARALRGDRTKRGRGGARTGRGRQEGAEVTLTDGEGGRWRRRDTRAT
jgi:hypothetical protein